MNVFIFTTNLNEWNSSIIKSLLYNNKITIKGIYMSKSFGGDKGKIYKIKRLLGYGIINLIRIFWQKLLFKKKSSNIKICIENFKRNCIPTYSGKNFTSHLEESNIKDIDIIVLIYFNRIIPKRYLNLSIPIINIHPSLLPKYKGAQPVFWALYNDEEKAGFSIHEVTEEIDGGNIYYQETLNIEKRSINKLMLQISDKIAEKIDSILIDIVEGRIISKKQDNNNLYFSRPPSKIITQFLNNNNRYY